MSDDNGEKLIKWIHHVHEILAICPECGQDCRKVAIAKLAYTGDACDCGTPEYSHIAEQLWHKACLIVYLTKHPEQQVDYRYIPNGRQDT